MNWMIQMKTSWMNSQNSNCLKRKPMNSKKTTRMNWNLSCSVNLTNWNCSGTNYLKMMTKMSLRTMIETN